MAKHKPTPDAAPAAPEGYTVLARRYRPQTFEELVGQEPVARALANALGSNRVAHAYLFTGSRGVGKTSTARILAKALNCEKGPTATPCGVCPTCRSIATGEDVDVLEIDAASNRGIDEVRALRSNVQYRPSRSRYKIYIIDEVHMLTKEAFNALLKTLEEPPPHVKFIFATTEVQKIPITILSRCQRFDFGGIPLRQIIDRLRAVVEGEGMQADDEALELVARRAGGSMRDAQSLLDQLLAFGGDRLTADQVHQLLGTAGDDRVAELADAVLAHDPKRALELLDRAAVGGLQLGELLDQLIGYWRDLMVAHCAGREGPDLGVPARLRDALLRQAKGMSLDTILAGLDVLSTTKARLRGSNHGRTLVEMALVRLGRLDDLMSLSQMARWLASNPSPHPPPRSGEGAVSGSPLAASGRGAGGVRSDPPTVAPPEGVKKKPLSADLNGGPPLSPAPGDVTAQTLPAVWSGVLATVGPLLARDLEKAGIPAIFGPNTLVLSFPATYNQAREHCQQPASLTRIDEALRRLTGHAWTLRVEAGAGTALPAVAAEERVEAPARPRRNTRDDAEKVPVVKRAIEVLGAAVHRVDDGFGETTDKPSAAEET